MEPQSFKYEPLKMTDTLITYAFELHHHACEEDTSFIGKCWGHTFSRILNLAVLPFAILIEGIATTIFGLYAMVVDGIGTIQLRISGDFNTEKIKAAWNIFVYGLDLLYSIVKTPLAGFIDPTEAAICFDPADRYEKQMIIAIEQYKERVEQYKNDLDISDVEYATLKVNYNSLVNDYNSLAKVYNDLVTEFNLNKADLEALKTSFYENRNQSRENFRKAIQISDSPAILKIIKENLRQKKEALSQKKEDPQPSSDESSSFKISPLPKSQVEATPPGSPYRPPKAKEQRT